MSILVIVPNDELTATQISLSPIDQWIDFEDVTTLISGVPLHVELNDDIEPDAFMLKLVDDLHHNNVAVSVYLSNGDGTKRAFYDYVQHRVVIENESVVTYVRKRNDQ